MFIDDSGDNILSCWDHFQRLISKHKEVPYYLHVFRKAIGGQNLGLTQIESSRREHTKSYSKPEMFLSKGRKHCS